MNQIKPYLNFIRTLLIVIFILGFIGTSYANYLADWPDDALCSWMDNPSPPDHIVKEVERRGIGCDGGKVVATSNSKSKSTSNTNTEKKTVSTKSNSSGKDSKIKIYDVEFSPGVLDELLKLVISKTDYDFSQYRLSSNNKNVSCRFTLRRIIYDSSAEGVIEGWNMARGKIIVNGSKVSFNGNWTMGGISGDPSYLEDEVNLKLTEDGHLVGKMAYFTHTVKDGEAPRNPLYPVLKKHKRSTPIDLSMDRVQSEQFIDVEDWAGGVLSVYSCKDI